jgi:hypothetical protein
MRTGVLTACCSSEPWAGAFLVSKTTPQTSPTSFRKRLHHQPWAKRLMRVCVKCVYLVIHTLGRACGVFEAHTRPLPAATFPREYRRGNIVSLVSFTSIVGLFYSYAPNRPRLQLLRQNDHEMIEKLGCLMKLCRQAEREETTLTWVFCTLEFLMEPAFWRV